MLKSFDLNDCYVLVGVCLFIFGVWQISEPAAAMIAGAALFKLGTAGGGENG